MDANFTVKSTNIINKSKNKCFSNDNVKKRGVFVERNAVSSVLGGTDATHIKPKRRAPPRPRPGQKKFLSSVLTILSKSTASTQYPDGNEAIDKERKLKPRRLKNDKTEAENCKFRYKSRVLNQSVIKDKDFVVLQSKKDIAQTPSNYSDTTNVRWSDIENSGKENSIYNEVLEGKKFKNNDESTAVTELGKNDDKIYKLFVDLLETTFNVYNKHAEKENLLKENDSNTILEINEEVAEKLEIKTDVKEEEFDDKTDEIDLDNDIYGEIENKHLNVKLSDIIEPKIKAKSFVHNKKTKNLPKSKSFEVKKSFAKSKKQTLLNIFKEQLEMDVTYEEPQNLYEALKVIAKNKRRYEKSVEYHKEKSKFSNDDRGNTECVFQQRNLFRKTEKKRKPTNASQKRIDVVKPKKVRTKDLKSIPSHKSVEVYGYNYEKSEEEEEEEEDSKRIIHAYHTSPSVSDLDYYTLLKYSDKSNSNISYQLPKLIYNK